MTRIAVIAALVSALVAATAATALAGGDRGSKPRGFAFGAYAGCKLDHTPGTEAFRQCVRERKEQRAALRAIVRACKAEGHAKRSEAFRTCVATRAAAQGIDLRAKRERVATFKAAVRSCKQQGLEPRSAAFRACVRTALQPSATPARP